MPYTTYPILYSIWHAWIILRYSYDAYLFMCIITILLYCYVGITPNTTVWRKCLTVQNFDEWSSQGFLRVKF